MNAFDRRFLAPAPAERIATLRILVGGYLLVYLVSRIPVFLSLEMDDRGFDPVGLARILEAPLPSAQIGSLVLATLAAGVAFTLGWCFRATGPLFAVLAILLFSYRSSWGMIFHTENLACLHALVLAFTASADAYSLDARRRAAVASRRSSPAPGRGPDARYGWPVRLLCAVTVATYFLAGVAKLELTGLSWATGETLRQQVAWDIARKMGIGSSFSPLGAVLVPHGWLFAPLSWATLVIELGAPLALFGRRLAVVWVASVMAFHWGVAALMAITFFYPLSGIAFASFFPAERLVPWIHRRFGPGRHSSALPVQRRT